VNGKQFEGSGSCLMEILAWNSLEGKEKHRETRATITGVPGRSEILNSILQRPSYTTLFGMVVVVTMAVRIMEAL
jgi:hypothetical protein